MEVEGHVNNSVPSAPQIPENSSRSQRSWFPSLLSTVSVCLSCRSCSVALRCYQENLLSIWVYISVCSSDGWVQHHPMPLPSWTFHPFFKINYLHTLVLFFCKKLLGMHLTTADDIPSPGLRQKNWEPGSATHESLLKNIWIPISDGDATDINFDTSQEPLYVVHQFVFWEE